MGHYLKKLAQIHSEFIPNSSACAVIGFVGKAMLALTRRREGVEMPPPRDKGKILDEIVHGNGKQGKFRQKFTKNKERNWLLALTLNSFAKVDEGESLSDVEKAIVDAARGKGLGEDEIKEHGRLYKQLPEQARKDFFPGRFAQFNTKTKYTADELKKDLPRIQEAILRQPNAVDVDVEAIHAGTAHERDFSEPSAQVLAEYGGIGVFRAVAPNTTPPKPSYTLKALSFRCNNETGIDWWGADEPFWIFGSTAGGTATTTRSPTFGGIDTGDTASFSATDGCLWGTDCAAHDFPGGEVGVHIELWEHDYGDPAKIQAGVATAFAAAAGVLVALGVTAWIGAVVAGVGAVIGWLLGFLDDDHIGDWTYVFTRQVLEDRLTKVGSVFNVYPRFTDGDGDYTLTVQAKRWA
jgi:hypothetical protein